MTRPFALFLIALALAPVAAEGQEARSEERTLRVYDAPSPSERLDPAFELIMEKVDQDIRYVMLAPFRLTPKGAAATGLTALTTLYLLGRDEDLLEGIAEGEGRRTEKVYGRLNVLGGSVPEFTAALYLAGYFLDSPSMKSKALQGLEAVALSAFFTATSAYLIGHASPSQSSDSNEFEWLSDYHSMPDMNTALAFSVAGVMAYGNGFLASLASYSLAAGIGLERVHDGNAWPSDVFLGAVLGTSIGRSVSYLSRVPEEQVTFAPFIVPGEEGFAGLMVQVKY